MFYPALLTDIDDTIAAIAETADQYPGVVIIHNVQDLSILYMNAPGLRQLNISLEQLRAMSNMEYHNRYFNPDDAKDYVPKIRRLLESNSDETITFFQQVRTCPKRGWVWHMSSIKILLRDQEEQPLLSITTSIPVNPDQHITGKVSRLLDENQFLRNHYHTFSQLGKREKEILKWLALGKNAGEIAALLFIAPTTVETHRRNIKRKLNVATIYELIEFARAFDLI
ncbi:DNA-binding CsgD family transcriptional regulator [Filimonas zeae]|uniref:HTH luxR-type domain-containing protein n=1 Tax=Filimonas zeae TaxID=1737353 RepID=A0A917MZF4_9BACT|nr:helix-turn-helix transcriptional regulator [Filimonas zeae]MDR6342870.1 DNA-binding CsgD family transcriptional regulator [Filimonas zeae]GGH83030.1 hypothetical protein GCM10011379_57810 [Filimonas zeae]